MIPLHKLKKLPRHQRLRKIANLLDAEDARFAIDDFSSPNSFQFQYLVDIARLLSEDEYFSPEAQKVILEASEDISSSFSAGEICGRRSINSLRHIVNEAVGKQIADWDFVDARGNLLAEKRTILPGVHIFLEDVRSPYNVGSIFRVAESFGVEKAYLSPLCASPEHPRASRSSMGCDHLVKWKRANLQELDGPFFALETGGIPLDDFDFPNEGTLIIGSEELGVSPAALTLAESSLGRVSIPTIGAKGSLNVSVAFGIAMREWCSRLI